MTIDLTTAYICIALGFALAIIGAKIVDEREYSLHATKGYRSGRA